MLVPLKIEHFVAPPERLQLHFGRLLTRRRNGALLFHGDAQASHVLADYFARTAFCEQEGAPCGHCRSCNLLMAGTLADAWHLLPEERSIKIDEVRLLTSHMGRKGLHSKRKLVLIERLDLTTREAGNALLKLLEEPPEDGWMLCTAPHPDAILPTLRSRLLPIAAVLDWQASWDDRDLSGVDLNPQASCAFSDAGLQIAGEILPRLSLQRKPELDALQKAIRGWKIGGESLAVHLEAIAYLFLHPKSTAAIEKNRSIPYNLTVLNGLNLSIRAAISAQLCESADAIRANRNVSLVLESWLLDARRLVRIAST